MEPRGASIAVQDLRRIVADAPQTQNGRLKASPSVDGPLFERKFESLRTPRNSLALTRCTDVLRATTSRLVLLTAPPGFGKTTLLAQWREVDSRPFACVPLDSGDNDAVLFWSYIIQAIRHSVPE